MGAGTGGPPAALMLAIVLCPKLRQGRQFMRAETAGFAYGIGVYEVSARSFELCLVVDGCSVVAPTRSHLPFWRH